MSQEARAALERIAELARQFARATDPVWLDVSEPELPQEGCSLYDALRNYERSLITQALARTGGNKAQAARLLRMNRTTLVERLKTLDISDWRSSAEPING